jgi:hypothetical protein
VKRWKVSRGGAGVGSAVWLSSLKLAKRHEAKYPNQYMIICYETLAREPEKTLRQICDFIGEEYTPVMLEMKGAEQFRDEGGNSSYGQHEPGRISTRSIGRFTEVLSPRQIAFMQLTAGPKMTEFKYELELIKLSVLDSFIFLFFDIPLNALRMMAWYILNSFLNLVGRSLPSYRILKETEPARAGV